jgi:hypothetical protein
MNFSAATSQLEYQKIVQQQSSEYISRNQTHPSSGCGPCNPCNSSICGVATSACCGDAKIAAGAAALFAALIFLGGSDNGSGSA